MLYCSQRSFSRTDKPQPSEISTSTRAQSPQSISLSPYLNQKINVYPSLYQHNWKTEIMPVCRSANFSTQEGRKYCEFKLMSKLETDAYFNIILTQTLVNQGKFPGFKLQDDKNREKTIVEMMKIQKNGRLNSNILHLAVRMFDMYFVNQPLEGNELSALSCVCMWLAAKLEDIALPKFKFWVSCCDRFLEQELTSMQIKVLEHFNFDLNIPTIYTFFNLVLAQIKLQQRTYYLCLYLMELSLLDKRMLEYLPSIIALSSLYIAMEITDSLKWNDDKYCGLLKVNRQELKECSTLLMSIMVEFSKKQDNYVVEKYATERCFKVSKITFRKAIR